MEDRCDIVFSVHTRALVLSKRGGDLCACEETWKQGRAVHWQMLHTLGTTVPRLHSRIVRRLIRMSSDLADDPNMAATTLNIHSTLPDGTRLIRCVVRAVPKTGGGRKHKKPGRISRPAEVKYGVSIPHM